MMAILDETHTCIVGLSEAGKTRVDIAAIVGVPVRTVQRSVKKFQEDGTYKCKPCGGSHAKKLSDRDVRAIIHVSKTHCHLTFSKITSMCPTQVSRRTIQRIFHKSGIFNRIAIKRPFLTPCHISQ